MNVGVVLLFCASVLLFVHDCVGTQQIWDHIFVSNNYNKYVRPSTNATIPTQVNISLSIIAVIEFNEVKETITVTGKLFLSWTDDFLRWEPQNFSHVDHIHLPQSEVWKPYIVLENSVIGQSELGTPSLQLLVDNNGRVEWKPIQVFRTTCAANVQKFPFDTQICSMTFEASGYAKNELIMEPVHDHIEFHEYGGTSGWTITETQVVVNEDSEEFHLVCSIKMSRNPTYFLLNIFLPISMLSFLNICVFILPVESGEKASFVVTVFLSLAVFLTIVSGKLPENSESIAYLNIYVFISTLLSTIIAIATIMQIRIYNRNQSIPVPWTLVKFTTTFTSSSDKKLKDTKMEDEKQTQNGLTKTKVEPMKLTDPDDCDAVQLEMKQDRKHVTVTWRRVVKALDNVFFCVFLVINLTMTITILAIAAETEHVEFAHAEEEHGH